MTSNLSQTGTLGETLRKVSSEVQNLKDKCLAEQNPDKAQTFARNLDILLKELSKLQAEAGGSRRDMSKHITSLRTASPKAKAKVPVELKNGSVYLIDGVPQRWDGNTFTKNQ